MRPVHSSSRVWASAAGGARTLQSINSGRRTGRLAMSNVRTARSPKVRSGAILLEVLISLGLMVFGLAIVGLQVSTSLESARKCQLWTTAIVLTETKMAELQAGAVPFKPTDEQVAGYFGIRYPGYSWRIQIEPCEIENLYMMTLEIGYNPSAIEGQIANPDTEINFDDQGTTTLRTVHRLVPKPADLDLNRDFGIDMTALQEQMGGGGQGGGQGGGTGGGEGGGEAGEGGAGGNAGSELWGLISEFLTKHPEIMNDSGGIDLEAVKNLPAEDFQAAMQILQQFVGRGSQLSQLQEQLGENLGETGQGGKGSGGSGGNGSGAGGNTGGRNGQNDGSGGQDGAVDGSGGTSGGRSGGATGGQTGGANTGQGRGGRNGGRGRDGDTGGDGGNNRDNGSGRGRDNNTGGNRGSNRDGNNRDGNDGGRDRNDGAGRDNNGGRNNDGGRNFNRNGDTNGGSGRNRENDRRNDNSNNGGRSSNGGRSNNQPRPNNGNRNNAQRPGQSNSR